MLVKLLHNPGVHISIPPLQPSVVPIKTAKFRHNKGYGRSVTLEQLPVTLAYVMTDYKCQGKTVKYVVVDLKTPSGPRSSSPTSAYIQQLFKFILGQPKWRYNSPYHQVTHLL